MIEQLAKKVVLNKVGETIAIAIATTKSFEHFPILIISYSKNI